MGINKKIIKFYLRDLFVFFQIFVFVFAFSGVPEALASVSFRAASAVIISSSNQSTDVSQPTGTQIGDLRILQMVRPNNTAFTAPAGWTKFSDVVISSAGRTALFWSIATSTAHSVKLVNSSNIICGAITSFSGASTTAPIATSTVNTKASASTVGTAPPAQTNVPGTMAVFVNQSAGGAPGAGGTKSGWSGADLSFVEVIDNGTSLGADCTIGLAYSSQIASTTSTGPRTVTIDSAIDTSGMILIRPNVQISGTLYSDEGTTPDTSGSDVIKLQTTATSTIYSTTTNSGSGAFVFNGLEPFPEGSAIRIWVDGDTNTRAFTQTHASSTCSKCYTRDSPDHGSIMNGNISGLDLYKNRLILRMEESTSTNSVGVSTSTKISNLAQYDGDNDTDIQYTANNSELTVKAGQMLYLWPATRFIPGGKVTIHGGINVDTDGSLKLSASTTPSNGLRTTSLIMGSNELSIAGSFLASSTSILSTTGTTTFSATSTTGSRPTKNIIASTIEGWDVSTAVKKYVLDTNSADLNPYGIFFKPDGLKMYFVGNADGEINEYDLGTAWDISTVTFLQAKSIASQTANPRGIYIRPDGMMAYIIKSTNGILQYNLATAWDISTATFVQEKNTTAEDGTPGGLFFKPDGLKLYATGRNGDEINEYDLGTAWDISTVTFLQNKSIVSETVNPEAVSFRSDGKKMYVLGDNELEVDEYDLGTAWDISTATFLQVKSVAGDVADATGLFLGHEGLKMYVASDGDRTIVQYNLSPTLLDRTGAEQQFTSSFYNLEFGSTTGSGGSWKIDRFAPVIRNNLAIISGTTTVEQASTISARDLSGITGLGTSTLQIRGNFSNAGRIIAPVGTTTFNGTSTSRTQYLSGFMTGSSTLNHVEFSDKSPKIFSNNASTTNFIISAWTGTTTGTTTQGTIDSSGNENFGLMKNGAFWDIGKIGPGINFSGDVERYVNAGSKTVLDNVSPLTVSAWVYRNGLVTGNDDYIISKAPDSSNGTFFRFGNSLNTSLTFMVLGSTHVWKDVISSTTGKWIHVAATWDGTVNSSGIHIYEDGAEKTSNTTQEGVSLGSDATADLLIGSSIGQLDNTSGFNGKIDDLRIYSRVLSANEISDLAHLSNPSSSNLVGWWKFDEAATTTAPSLLSISGDYYNAGVFNHNSGTVYVASTTARQNFSGIMTGDSSFNNLTILNNSGTDAATSSSVVFLNAASTTGTFTAVTPSTKIQFPLSATTSVNHLTLNGQAAGTKVRFRTYDPLRTGLVGWWKMDEGTGTVTQDSSGSGNTGTLKPTATEPTWASGYISNALNFDGTEDYVNIPSNSTLSSLTGALTVSAWFKADTFPGAPSAILNAGEVTADGISLQVDASGGGITLTTKGVKDYSSTSISFSANTWNHVVAVLDSNWDVTYFINGVNTEKVNWTSAPVGNSDDNWFIGASANNAADPSRWWFDGLIDDVRIYNRALSSTTEIGQLYAQTSSKHGLEVTGTESISYTDFMDTNACNDTTNLSATDGTNADSGSNSCIDFSVQTVLTQSNYQWFVNDGNIGTGGEKAGLNTAATLNDGNVLRLRMNVLVAGAALSSQAFDLQYGTIGASCAAVADWTALGTPGSASIWRGYNNTTLSDGANLTTLFLPNSNVLETYEENGLSAAALPNSIAVGQRGEWDWVVQNNGATAGTTYCFRMIKNGGTTFTHGNYPQVIASAAVTSGGGSVGSGGGGPAVEIPSVGGQNNQGGGGGGEGGSPPENPTPPPPGGGGQGGGGGDTGFIPLMRFFAEPYYFIGHIFGILGLR